jgi:hypothetical protein
MAAGDIGRQVVYHEDGAHVCWVSDYVAGRDAGDHFLVGFFNAAATEAGRGNVIQTWSVYRDTGEDGTFSWAGEATAPPESPPDHHPEHPIVLPPPEIWPSPGHPAHPIAPGGGPTHPIVLPPDVDIWPDEGKPEHPIVIPPDVGIWPSPGVPTHPIVIPGDPPGIWGDIEFPEHPIVIPPPVEIWPPDGKPEHPIFLPPSIWPPDGKPEHPIVLPPDPTDALPSLDPDNVPDHPELPDLNFGGWYWLQTDGTLTYGFVTAPVHVEHPSYDPWLPTTGTPGSWVVTAYKGLLTWAWIPDNAITYP